MATEPEQEFVPHKKDDYTLKQWDRKIEEEEAAWRHAGIDLDNMRMSGRDLFFMQARLQALTNCFIAGDFSEEALNLNLKLIVYDSMRQLRSIIEPQMEEMKRRESVQVPQIIMPWEQRKTNGS